MAWPDMSPSTGIFLSKLGSIPALEIWGIKTIGNTVAVVDRNWRLPLSCVASRVGLRCTGLLGNKNDSTKGVNAINKTTNLDPNTIAKRLVRFLKQII
jgi:hypothetical protein